MLCQCEGNRERTVVKCDDVQAVEQLPLVLMDPLHLHIKHGVGVDLHFVVLFQVGSKLQLVLLEIQGEQGSRHEERSESIQPYPFVFTFSFFCFSNSLV